MSLDRQAEPAAETNIGFKQLHHLAQALYHVKHGDWGYDPDDPKHGKWMDRAIRLAKVLDLKPEHYTASDGVGTWPSQPGDHGPSRYVRVVGMWLPQ